MGLLRTLHFLSRFSLMLGYLLRAFAEKQAGNTAGCDECMRRAFAMLEQLEAEVRRKLDRAKAEVADAAPLACADASLGGPAQGEPRIAPPMTLHRTWSAALTGNWTVGPRTALAAKFVPRCGRWLDPPVVRWRPPEDRSERHNAALSAVLNVTI